MSSTWRRIRGLSGSSSLSERGHSQQENAEAERRTEDDGEELLGLDVLEEDLAVDLLDAGVVLLVGHPLQDLGLVHQVACRETSLIFGFLQRRETDGMAN